MFRWSVDAAEGWCCHPVLGELHWRPVRLRHPDEPGVVYVVDDRSAGERRQQGRWDVRFCRLEDALDTLAGLRPAPDRSAPAATSVSGDVSSLRGMQPRALWRLRATLDPAGTIVGAGLAMLELFAELAVAADGGQAVLLHGPTGVGKSTLCEVVHRRWGRPGPLIRVSAAGSGGDPLAERGEWVGYGRRHGIRDVPAMHDGHLAHARGGTLFVDDADSLSESLQALLLDVLEGRPVRRVGGDALQSDVRVVFATGIALDVLRPDLVARLGGRVSVPPFAARPHDALAFATAYAQTQRVTLAPRAHLAIARQAAWPENARGVEAVVRGGAARAALEGRVTVRLGDLPDRLDDEVRADVGALGPDEARAALWARADAAAREEGFEDGAGLQARAAALLGKSRASASAAYRAGFGALP